MICQTIQLEKVSKRFGFEWIFRDVQASFEAGKSYAILGANGSGKSTLLQVIAASLTPSKGTVVYTDKIGKTIEVNKIHQTLSLAAPYLELVEEFSLKELLTFQSHFKPFVNQLSIADVIDIVELPNVRKKAIRHYSSGMKQRVKLVLAILADSSILLLDEPATNLDATATEWYRRLVQQYAHNRVVIVASNQEKEYDFCDNKLVIEDFKKM
ncbi:MAG: ATP-binding cassette domain-containing protein [Chitinophagales bacterium]